MLLVLSQLGYREDTAMWPLGVPPDCLGGHEQLQELERLIQGLHRDCVLGSHAHSWVGLAELQSNIFSVKREYQWLCLLAAAYPDHYKNFKVRAANSCTILVFSRLREIILWNSELGLLRRIIIFCFYEYSGFIDVWFFLPYKTGQ